MTSEVSTLRLKDCLSLLKDGTHNPPERSEKGIKFIAGATDIKYLDVNFSKCTFVCQENYQMMHKKWEPKVNDVLLTIVGTVGNTAIVREQDLPFTMQRSIATLRPNEKIDFRYLFYWLNSYEAKWALSSRITATGQPGIYLGELGKIPISIPRLEVQKKISEKLYLLDQAIRINKKIVEVIENKLNALFRSWFIDFDPVKAKAERRLPYGMDEETAALFPDSFDYSEYGLVPDGWDVTKVSELCKRVDYGFTASSDEDPTGSKFLRITDIIPRQVNWNSVPYCKIPGDLLLKYRLESGDIVIARTGAGVGVAKRIHDPPVDTVFASYLVRIKPKNEILSIYLGAWLESDQYLYYIQGISYGAGQPQCSAKYLVTFDLVLPPIEILNAFNERVKSLLDLQKYSIYSMDCLANTRDALLPRLMSGELKIN